MSPCPLSCLLHAWYELQLIESKAVLLQLGMSCDLRAGLQMKSGAALNPIAACPATASHLELVQIAPRLQRLDALLQVVSSLVHSTLLFLPFVIPVIATICAGL